MQYMLSQLQLGNDHILLKIEYVFGFVKFRGVSIGVCRVLLMGKGGGMGGLEDGSIWKRYRGLQAWSGLVPLRGCLQQSAK